MANLIELEELCECCGAADVGACGCEVILVEEHDPNVGYRGECWFCVLHNRCVATA